MKNAIIIIPIMLLLFACNGQENDAAPASKISLHSADIKQISGTNSVITDFDATLLDLSGQEITDLA